MDRKKLALIHIVKNELNLRDAQYRAILQEAAGVKSAKDLDEEKFRRLMNYFVRSKHYRINPDGLTIRQKLFIKYLAQQLDWSRAHLKNFIRKYYGKTEVNKLTKKEAIGVIESLKSIKQRQGAMKPGEDYAAGSN